MQNKLKYGGGRVKYCHNCNKDFPEDRTYCDTCGKKLSVKVEKEHNPYHREHHNKSKVAPWLIPWIVFGVLLVIAGILFLPTKVLSYQVEVPYIATEKYTIEVPYEDVEEYTVQVPYETQETYIESIPYTEQQPYQECFIICWTNYRNVTKYKDVTKTKTVTKYRDETRYKKVTKTRTETREREVRKTRTETKQKEVNWIFGFDAIIKFRNL